MMTPALDESTRREGARCYAPSAALDEQLRRYRDADAAWRASPPNCYDREGEQR